MKILDRASLLGSIGRHRWEAIAILFLAILAAVVPFLLFAWQAVGDTKAEIETERLRLAQMAAAQADRILSEAFFEIELASALFPISEDDMLPDSEGQPLRTLYGQAASFSAGVLFLDSEGKIVLAEPSTAATGLDRGPAAQALAAGAGAQSRQVSEPFASATTGNATTALSVPIYDEDGQRVGTAIGLVDLTEPLISDLVEPAQLLGITGHADLVDERGLVLASTESGHVMTSGDHPDFYRRMAERRIAAIERVAHEPDDVHGDQSRWHVMAYAPLRNAPWGITIGASEGETMRAAHELRRTLVILGVASVAVLIVGAVLVIRRVPARPV